MFHPQWRGASERRQNAGTQSRLNRAPLIRAEVRPGDLVNEHLMASFNTREAG